MAKNKPPFKPKNGKPSPNQGKGPPQAQQDQSSDADAQSGAQQGDFMGGQGDSSDSLIAKVQDSVRAHIPANLRVAVMKIVMAGEKVMYDPSTHGLMLKGLQSSTDPAEAVAAGVAQLIVVLWRQSQNSMPLPAVTPAAILLCMEALDFAEKAGQVQVTSDIVDRTTQNIVAILMQKVGLSPQKVAQVVAQQRAQQGGQPPAQPGAQQPPAQPGAQPPSTPQPQSGGLISQQMGAS